MPNMKPSEICQDVETVLRKASKGKGTEPQFLTAYQILDRLPQAIRDRLVNERTLGGRGAGVRYSAASVVSDAAEDVKGVQIAYVDTKGLLLEVAGQQVNPGNRLCGMYRLPG